MDRPVLGGGAAAFLGAAFFLAGAFLAGAFFLAWHLLGAVRNATIPFLVVKLQFVVFFYTLYIYLFQFIFDEKMYQLFWYGVAACFTATAYPHPDRLVFDSCRSPFSGPPFTPDHRQAGKRGGTMLICF